MKRFLLMAFGVTLVSALGFAQCDELYFSEYIEGSSNNKGFEVYNPSNSSVDLSSYSILVIGNGGSFTNTFQLYGNLGAYGTFNVCTDQADAMMQNAADTALSFPSVAHFNGDDAVVLLKGTDTIDCIGERFNDPGSEWTVGSGSTKEHTLVRKASVKAGNTDWSTASGEWDVYTQNTYTYYGSHTSDCFVPTSPEIGFATSGIAVMENAGTVNVSVSISNPSSTMDATVDVYVTGGSAVSGTDYTATTPQTLTFAKGSTADQTYTITLTDNMDAAIDKTIQLKLRNATNADLTKDSSFFVTIENDDYWKTKIVNVKENDADFVPKYDKVKVEVTGIVYGPDYDGNAGISFTIIDSTAGVNIFNFRDVSDYVVTEGDEITVRGEMTHYYGLIEVFADSIKVESQNNTLKDPVVVMKPSEETESDFIEIRKVWIADTTTVWPSNGNVDITNGTDTFQLRVDRDVTDMVGQPVAHDTMDIRGIGGQYDGSAFPLDAGYQIFPRSINDVMEWNKASVKAISSFTRVYPNPTNGLVVIRSAKSIDNINVMNLQGVQVASYKNVNGLRASVNLSNKPAGMYLIEVTSGNQVSYNRIIVE